MQKLLKGQSVKACQCLRTVLTRRNHLRQSRASCKSSPSWACEIRSGGNIGVSEQTKFDDQHAAHLQLVIDNQLWDKLRKAEHVDEGRQS